MKETPSERRLAENEAIFRQINEQVQTGLDETNKLAREDNQSEFMVTTKSSDHPLQFYCECSDENCAVRISINLHEYKVIHENRRQFIVATGHEVLSVEEVVMEQPTYTIVEKNIKPPENPGRMNPTSVDNT